jgi:hypothetical protein
VYTWYVDGIHRSLFFKVNIICICLDSENNTWEQKQQRKFILMATISLGQIKTFLAYFPIFKKKKMVGLWDHTAVNVSVGTMLKASTMELEEAAVAT